MDDISADSSTESLSENTQTPEVSVETNTDATPAAEPQGTVEQSAAPAQPAYNPDFKYKVWGQERELDERVRGLIKSKEDEEWVKSVFEKADGVEGFKQQREEIKQEYARLHGEVQNVLKAVDMGDFKTAFASMGVEKPELKDILTGFGYSKDEIIRHAYELAQLTPEQEQYYARQRELERQNRELSMTLQTREQEQYQAYVQSQTQELQRVLSTPDVAPIVQAYDAHHGAGAFWEEVRQKGIAHYALHKRDIPVKQAVDEVVRLIRIGQQAFAPQPTPAATPAAKAPNELPVIPAVGSGGTQTPVRKKPRSISELKSMASELTD